MRISVGIDVAKETHWVTALDDRAEDSKEVGHFFVVGGRCEMFLKFDEIEHLILRVTEPLSFVWECPDRRASAQGIRVLVSQWP